MKKNYLSTITLSLIIISPAHTEQNVATSFSTRSISRNAARDLAGWTNYINKDSSPKTVYGALSVTPEYSHTFNGSIITNTLFGDNLIHANDTDFLKISGSQVTNRGPHDLLADYFYLPTDFESIVQFKPVIDNVIIDFGFYLGLDAWKKGMYFWLHAPFAHTRWDLNIEEHVTNQGINNSAQGYYTPNAIPRNLLLDSFTNYANGITVPDIETIMFEELKFAKMSNKRLVRSRLAEIRTGFGWNFYAQHDYHGGFNLQLAAPTGLRPAGEFLFEPLVGNGHFLYRQRAGGARRGHAEVPAERQMVDDRERNTRADGGRPIGHFAADPHGLDEVESKAGKCPPFLWKQCKQPTQALPHLRSRRKSCASGRSSRARSHRRSSSTSAGPRSPPPSTASQGSRM
jgi:hypothetical protein